MREEEVEVEDGEEAVEVDVDEDVGLVEVEDEDGLEESPALLPSSWRGGAVL